MRLRFSRVQVCRRLNHLPHQSVTDARWLYSHTAFIWHARRVRAANLIRESFLGGSAFRYIGADDYRVCCVGGESGPVAVILVLKYQSELWFRVALRGFGLQNLLS